MIEIHLSEIPADCETTTVCEVINDAIRQAFGVPHETAATPEAKPEPMTMLELVNTLVERMQASGRRKDEQAEAGWIAMQIVGGTQAAEVVRRYCDVSPSKS